MTSPQHRRVFFSPPVMLSPGCFPEAHDFEPFKFPTVASSDPYWGDSSVFATGPLLNLVGPEGKNARDSTAACGSESSHLRGWDLSHPTEAAFYPHRAFLSDSSGCLAPSLFLNLDGLIGPSSSPVHGTQPGSFLVMPDTSTPPGDGVFSGEDDMPVPEPADLIKLEPFNDPEPFIQESEPLVEPKLRKRRLDGPPRYLACFFCRLRKIRCLPEEGTSVCMECHRRKRSCDFPERSNRGARNDLKDKKKKAASTKQSKRVATDDSPVVVHKRRGRPNSRRAESSPTIASTSRS
ncbi:hypothetical protein OF83DRAFT_761309 [Amylostereum chailletii]|nr:hypothetical protein OF83DRAFT_761309 [Amylostereum chailletii]